MPRFILAVSAGALGLAFTASALMAARGEGTVALPGDGTPCYYNQSTCTYTSGAYWSSCDSGYEAGWILTSNAKIICDTYHGI
jgi:hypothetical protein